MKSENYIVIHSWMIQDCGLTGNELLVYAVIYGFTRDGKQTFFAKIETLTESLKVSKQTVINCLNSLVSKGLINRQKRAIGETSIYKAIISDTSKESLPTSTKSVLDTSTKNVLASTKSVHGTSTKIVPDTSTNFVPNNTLSYNTLNESKDLIKYKEYTPADFEENETIDFEEKDESDLNLNSEEKRKKVAPKKEKFGEHQNVSLTDEEYSKLRKRFARDDLDWIINRLSNYKLSKNKTYKSDYGAINSWVIDSFTDFKKKQNGNSKHTASIGTNAFGSIRDKIKREIHERQS